MQNMYRNLDLADLASKIRTFTLNLQDFEMVSPTLARVAVTITGQVPKREQLRASMADLFKGLASPVMSSFRALPNTGSIGVAIGFVKAASEVRSLEDEDKGKYKAMSSNLLMDNTDTSLWEIRKGGAGQYLIKQGEEDLSELAGMLQVRKAGMPTLAEVASMPTSPKEFAAFVDLASEEVLYGYVVGEEAGKSVVVAFSEDKDVYEVSAAHMIEVIELDGADTKAFGMEMAASGLDRAAMVEYYKKAYSYSPEYIQEIINMIDQHAFA